MHAEKVELFAIPGGSISYTTDGASPETTGRRYDGPIEIDDAAKLILAIADFDGVKSRLLAKRMEKTSKLSRVGDKKAGAEMRMCEKLKGWLSEGKPARTLSCDDDDQFCVDLLHCCL
jgi:hypothetical protein